MNLVADAPWTNRPEACQLPTVLRAGLRDAYSNVLNEGIPADLARYFAALEFALQGTGRQHADQLSNSGPDLPHAGGPPTRGPKTGSPSK